MPWSEVQRAAASALARGGAAGAGEGQGSGNSANDSSVHATPHRLFLALLSVAHACNSSSDGPAGGAAAAAFPAGLAGRHVRIQRPAARGGTSDLTLVVE